MTTDYRATHTTSSAIQFAKLNVAAEHNVALKDVPVCEQRSTGENVAAAATKNIQVRICDSDEQGRINHSGGIPT